MTFSARSFSLPRSASGGVPRGAVPFMGCVVITPSARWRNSSGETLATPAAAE